MTPKTDIHSGSQWVQYQAVGESEGVVQAEVGGGRWLQGPGTSTVPEIP